MNNIASKSCDKLSQKYVSYMGRKVPQDHDNKILRPSASFMINMTELNFKTHYFEGLQIGNLYQKK